MNRTWLESIYPTYKSMSDREWCDLIHQSIVKPERFVNLLPGLPPLEIQMRLNGQPAKATEWRTRKFYLLLKEVTERYGKGVAQGTRILDFGVGWGRLLRYFLKDTELKNLVGIDVAKTLLPIWRKNFPGARLHLINTAPPLLLDPPSSFDLVYAHSVFSHLPGELADLWVTELASHMLPGGIFVMTTFSGYNISSRHIRGSDLKASHIREKYENGELLFIMPQSKDFGVAYMPKAYIETHWSEHFELKSFIDYRSLYPQAIAVLKKRN